MEAKVHFENAIMLEPNNVQGYELYSKSMCVLYVLPEVQNKFGMLLLVILVYC